MYTIITYLLYIKERDFEMKTTVVNVSKSRYTVYIGRPSEWGNPFIIGRDGTRREVIEKYKAWILTQSTLLAKLPTLKGEILGCYCFPKNCHGHVLVELIESELTN